MTHDSTDADRPTTPGPDAAPTGAEGAPPSPLPAAAAEPMTPEPSQLEIQRRLAAAKQPRPWKPSDKELDPTSETGWEVASKHELLAIRPEDLPTLAQQPDRAAAAVAAAAAASVSAAAASSALPTSAASPAGPDASAAAPLAAAPPDWVAAVMAPSPPATAPAQPATNVIDFPPAETALSPSTRIRPRRLAKAKAGLEAAARPFLLLALFGFGASLGWWTWVRALPPVAAAAPIATLEPGTTDQVPIQVQSLLAAIETDSQTQLQVVLPEAAYREFSGELKELGVTRMQGARALATYNSGTDSATQIVIAGTDDSGNSGLFNLVVHLRNGEIIGFR